MQRVRLLTIVAGLSLALAGNVQAATLLSSTTDLPSDVFSAPTFSTGTLVGVTGSVSGQYASPFGDYTSPYNAVQSGSATYEFGGPFNRLSFVFGSPDDYNNITFLRNGIPVDTFFTTGTSLDRGSNYFVTLGTGLRFDAVRFTSGTPALEFSNVSVSAVPLPASAPMFGAALLALAGLGYSAKRKKASTAA